MIFKLICLLKEIKDPKTYLDILKSRKKKVREKNEFTVFKLLDIMGYEEFKKVKLLISSNIPLK